MAGKRNPLLPRSWRRRGTSSGTGPTGLALRATVTSGFYSGFYQNTADGGGASAAFAARVRIPPTQGGKHAVQLWDNPFFLLDTATLSSGNGWNVLSGASTINVAQAWLGLAGSAAGVVFQVDYFSVKVGPVELLSDADCSAPGVSSWTADGTTLAKVSF